MASWTNLAAAFAYGTKLTSQQMQQLRDNITAIMEGRSGAPMLLTHAIWRGGDAVHTETTETYTDHPITIFRKKGGMETVRLYARIARTDSTSSRVRLRINSTYSASQNTSSTSYVMVDAGSIDVSGLSNNTNYEMAIQIKKDNGLSGNALLNGYAVYLE